MSETHTTQPAGTDTRTDSDDTARPEQDSDLGRDYYYNAPVTR